eukprot:Gregarina_sp_Poly_1__1667@NODE_1427_length_4171_cov_112_011452_g949_i0_p3_GENE_NODE_1427_length_4171_cov_112_011452_g949_i0NODE_1427_length_4171_cov_112_011452_g949_i0_p3_ORF_typecomplete_len131_score15_95_NODE_1427_length_4171_cov_112_011452_g949_i016952087
MAERLCSASAELLPLDQSRVVYHYSQLEDLKVDAQELKPIRCLPFRNQSDNPVWMAPMLQQTGLDHGQKTEARCGSIPRLPEIDPALRLGSCVTGCLIFSISKPPFEATELCSGEPTDLESSAANENKTQ